MPITAYLPDSIIHRGRILTDLAVLAEAGRVAALVHPHDVPAAAEKVKLDGLMLAPALVDLQVNGGGGFFFNQSPEKLGEIVAAHRAHGTAALLATHISDDLEKIPRAAEAVKAYRKKAGGVAGLHLEGPFLNENRKGIHAARALQKGTLDVFKALDLDGLGTLLVTLAPERAELEDVRQLAEKGAIICAGHSAPNAAQLHKAKQAGLTGVTHLYNGMGPMAARAPGLAGLALVDDALACSLICDGAHVDTAMIALARKAKPPGKLFLVSDAMPPAGQQPQRDFAIGGEKISVRNGRCENADGTLTGCALTLFECVRVAVHQAGIPLEEALAMASLYPAQFIGIDADYGSLDPGACAALIAFDGVLKLEKVIM